MQLRTLGRGGLRVSALGLGCMSMSEFYGKNDEAESIATIQRALDLGVDFLDTADMYGVGRNEELVGRAVRGRRDRVVIATKFGIVRSTDGARLGISGKADYVRSACEASLRRLGVDAIDLYYQHRVDPSVPIEETVGAMKRLIEQGKVRFLGLCEAAPATIRRAHSVHPISALQSEFSLLYRVEAESTLPTLRELGISFVAYSPLGRSWLSGRVQRLDDIPSDDRRRDHPRFHEANFAKNLELVHRIEQIAKERNCTPAQLALAWLLAQGSDVVPIPGTKRRERLDENIKAADVRLAAGDVERIAAAIPAGAAAGTRYPEAQLKGVHI
jgi:aryl-alcohol dehydrogenase-like predicted oxidoreductase